VTTIEEITPEHFGLVAEWLSRPEINRWLTAEWRGRLVTSVTVAMAVRNQKNRLFVVRSDGAACGLTALADIDAADSTAMVWYFLGERMLSGMGIITEAVKQLALRSFGQLGLHSVYAWVMEDNTASITVLQKAGRIRRATSSGGLQVDRIYFDLITNEGLRAQ
jgi:RimJ/RimL family protein N-acetyltransferase